MEARRHRRRVLEAERIVMERTPVTLLQRLRGPADPEAWDRFAELYTPVVFRWARGLGLQESDAADLVQDVFATLLRELPRFVYDDRKSFRAWLRAVALNRYRTLKRGAATVAPGAPPEEPSAPEEEAFWEHEYREHVVARALEVMRAEFAESTWRACWLTAVEGKSAADAGRELGLTEGAVRAAKFRVLARLRLELVGMVE